MFGMKKMLLVLGVVCLAVVTARALPLSIYDVQYTTDPSGNSPYMDQVVSCTGGIVINKWVGNRVKLTIVGPTNPNSWGGIIAKTAGSEFDNIQVGDRVSFTDVLVEDLSGNTQLSIDANSAVNLVSSGNALPESIKITASSLSEQYESMKVVLADVEITAMGLGKYSDNYNLQNAIGDYWAGDYMNVDAGGLYHPYIAVGAVFESISGIVEHKMGDGWDYYQMLTTGTYDFVVPEPAAIILLITGAIILRKRQRA